MCRNIKKLRQPDRNPTEEELTNAALQFVRKVTGYRVPSKKNKKIFDRAVSDVARSMHRFFEKLPEQNNRCDSKAVKRRVRVA